MEYYGNTICISKADLTRDDRPELTSSSMENFDISRFRKGASERDLAPIMGDNCYKQLVNRGRIKVIRKGIGRSVTALVELKSLPEKYRKAVERKYGTASGEYAREWFKAHYVKDTEAWAYFSRVLLPSGKRLSPQEVAQYVIDASTLEAVIRLMDDTIIRRNVTQGPKPTWEEMAGAMSFYREEYGHTLPLTASRLSSRVKEFKKHGYASLLSGKYGNQCRRLVSMDVERVLLSIASRPNKPWINEVHTIYQSFREGLVELYDTETGELYDPERYPDLSLSAVRYYLTKPENMVLVDYRQMSGTTFMHEQRPHVLRHAPTYSLSKVTMDDRDLPRKLKDTKQRPKAYYAYDVRSGAVIGHAYSRDKDRGLVVEMFRDMFRLLYANGWGCPGEVEVENHLMTQWKEDFLKAGTVFPCVRFCAPQNSQEKSAETYNRVKKMSFEHRAQIGVGRFYAKSKKYRTEAKKVYDQYNDTYEDARYYDWDQLIADDLAVIREYNNSPHPDKKRYGGRTRWEVLAEFVNPNLPEIPKEEVAKYIGEAVRTSVRRNSHVRVNYEDFWLSSPSVIGKLAPNDFDLDVYYIPNPDGSNPSEAYAYQNGTFVDTLRNVGTFNTSAFERTEEDERIMTEQLEYCYDFDRHVRNKSVKPSGLQSKTASPSVNHAAGEDKPSVVNVPELKSYEDDFDIEAVKARQARYDGRGKAAI